MNYEHEALLFADKHGIIEYQLDDQIMTYHETWYDGHAFVKWECKRNLDTNEETRKPLA